MILPVWTMAPSKVAKHTSLAASKVKSKLLNSSSFFKVSLKTNNKALAVALAAEKVKSRQLEWEIVYLKKQVEGLCFDMAVKKYKERKLFVLLKNLQSGTLNHLDMITDLFSADIDAPKSFGDNLNCVPDIGDEVLPIPAGRLSSRLHIPKDVLCPPQQPTEDVDVNDVGVLRSPNHIFNVVKDHKSIATLPEQTPSSLKNDIDRLSLIYAQNGYDVNTVPGFQCRELAQSNGEKPNSSDLQLSGRLEKTGILDMELTLTAAPDIVTVGERKLSCYTDKNKGTKTEDEATSNKIHKPQKKTTQEKDAPSCTEGEKGAQDAIKNTISQKGSSQCKNTVSRIPKIKKSALTNPKKKQKSKSGEQLNMENTDTHLPDLDDYFHDVEYKKSTNPSKPVESNPQENAEAMPNINFRRSKTKDRTRSSTRKKTLFFPPVSTDEVALESEWAFLESAHDLRSPESAIQEQDKAVDRLLNRSLEEDKYMSVKAHQNASTGHKEPTEVQISSKINYRKTRSKREVQATRRTFDVPPLPYCQSNDDENNTNVEGEFKLTEMEDDKQDNQVQISAQSIDRNTLSVEEKLDKSHSNSEDSTKSVEMQKRKAKCRGTFVIAASVCDPSADAFDTDNEVTCVRSSKEAVKPTTVKEPREGNESLSNTQTSVTSYKRFWAATTDDADANVKEPIDNDANDPISGGQLSKKAKKPQKEISKSKKKSTRKKPKRSEHKIVLDLDQPDINKSVDNSQLADSLFGPLEDDLHTGVNEMKSKMNRNTKQYRKTSKLHSPKHLRETFVVYNHFVPSDLTAGLDGGLVTDEVPPWLNADVSTADTEMGSMLSSPRRGASCRAEECAPSANNSIQVGVLTSLTNTISTPDEKDNRQTRKRKGPVSYKEPALNSKMRCGDKFTDTQFLSSPFFGKRKSKKTSAKQSSKNQMN